MCNWIAFWFADSEDPTCFPRNTKNPFESCIWDLKHPETELSFRARVRFMLLLQTSRLGHALADAMNATHISICKKIGLEVVFGKPWQRMPSGNYIYIVKQWGNVTNVDAPLVVVFLALAPFDMSGAECCNLKHGPLGQERCWQVKLRVLDCFPQREVQGKSNGLLMQFPLEFWKQQNVLFCKAAEMFPP